MASTYIPIYERLPSPSESSFIPDANSIIDRRLGRIRRKLADVDDPLAFCLPMEGALMVCSPQAVTIEGYSPADLYAIGYGNDVSDYEIIIGTVLELDEAWVRVSEYSDNVKHHVIQRDQIRRAAKVMRWLILPKDQQGDGTDDSGISGGSGDS